MHRDSPVRLGKYELMRRLATGGMAEIYLARQAGIEGFEKLVVLKRILPHCAHKSDYVDMFLDEARLAAALHHPNIVQVYDIGREDEEYFFAMEFVHGEDVRNIRKLCARLRRRLPLEHALNIVIHAAAGVHAAHEERGFDGAPLGIVHRDISPSNIQVSFDGCVKVIDFGVAKAGQRRHETRSGAIKGKVSYMSPEQCRGEAVDRRSDIFSLGTVLYQLTTGRRPFAGETEYEIIQEIGEGRVIPPSRATGGRYPFALECIVMRALARDPADRYETAQELQLDLEAFAAGSGLKISAIELGAFMRDLFAEKLKLWRLMYRDDLSRCTTGDGDSPASRTGSSPAPSPQPARSRPVSPAFVRPPAPLPSAGAPAATGDRADGSPRVARGSEPAPDRAQAAAVSTASVDAPALAPAPRRRRGSLVLVASAALALVCGAGLGMLLYGPAESAGDEAPERALPPPRAVKVAAPPAASADAGPNSGVTGHRDGAESRAVRKQRRRRSRRNRSRRDRRSRNRADRE